MMLRLPPELRLIRSTFDRRQWPILVLSLCLPLLIASLSHAIGSPKLDEFEAWKAAARASLSAGVALGLGLVIGLVAADLRAELLASPALTLLPRIRARLLHWILWPSALSGAVGSLVAWLVGAPGGVLLGFVQGLLSALLPWTLRHGLFHGNSFIILAAGAICIHGLEGTGLALYIAPWALVFTYVWVRRTERGATWVLPRVSLLGFGETLMQDWGPALLSSPVRVPLPPPRLQRAEDYLEAIDYEFRSGGGAPARHAGSVAPMVYRVTLLMYSAVLIQPLFEAFFGHERQSVVAKVLLNLWAAVFGSTAGSPATHSGAEYMVLTFSCMLVGTPSLLALLVLRHRFPYALSRADRAEVADSFSGRVRRELLVAQLLTWAALAAVLLIVTPHRPEGLPVGLVAILAGLALEPIALRYFARLDRQLRERRSSGWFVQLLLATILYGLLAMLLMASYLVFPGLLGKVLWFVLGLGSIAFHLRTRRDVLQRHFARVEL